MRGKKRKARTVKQHPTPMFHGIPGRVNSHACKSSKPAFLLFSLLCHFMNQILTVFLSFGVNPYRVGSVQTFFKWKEVNF